MITIANANALHIPLSDQSVQCVITSPPYWGLRDYGISDQIGLESTPAAYVAHIVAVMRECWRVLRDDGVLWLNLGDSYARQAGSDYNKNTYSGMKTGRTGREKELFKRGNNKPPDGLKEKDLCGIPWRVAFALQEDGWYLRSDIIWSKPNPMPESVTDRPTKAHEYVFLLTKQARYYYDAEAIKEQGTKEPDKKLSAYKYEGDDPLYATKQGIRAARLVDYRESGRNRRSVWTVATLPYSGAHFATFPPKLIEPMILAGTSARGECPHCGKAWVRVVERESLNPWSERKANGATNGSKERGYNENHGAGMSHDLGVSSNTLGWQPQCTCPPHDPIPQTVLDPFAGSGTTGSVAVKHGRRAVLLDLNTKYIDLQFERTNGVQITMQM